MARPAKFSKGTHSKHINNVSSTPEIHGIFWKKAFTDANKLAKLPPPVGQHLCGKYCLSQEKAAAFHAGKLSFTTATNIYWTCIWIKLKRAMPFPVWSKFVNGAVVLEALGESEVDGRFGITLGTERTRKAVINRVTYCEKKIPLSTWKPNRKSKFQ